VAPTPAPCPWRSAYVSEPGEVPTPAAVFERLFGADPAPTPGRLLRIKPERKPARLVSDESAALRLRLGPGVASRSPIYPIRSRDISGAPKAEEQAATLPWWQQPGGILADLRGATSL